MNYIAKVWRRSRSQHDCVVAAQIRQPRKSPSSALAALRAALTVLAVVATAQRGSAEPALRSLETGDHRYQKGDWEYSFESAFTFHVIPNPFASLVNLKLSRSSPFDYKLATQLLAARYRLTNPSGPWLLRGSLQASATLVGSAIVDGPESYFAGLALGLRYDFVQPGARVVPYVELRGGPGFTDSNGAKYAQQQDFVFTYLLGVGLRYDVSARWSLSVGALDQHLSNGYLAEENWGFDSLGLSVGVLARF